MLSIFPPPPPPPPLPLHNFLFDFVGKVDTCKRMIMFDTQLGSEAEPIPHDTCTRRVAPLAILFLVN
jgi:hypothetical protein